MGDALAGGLAMGAINAFSNTITAGLNNISAKKREEEARRENFYYGELAANAADRRTRSLYNDLQSPEAILKQYENAGLSPSLMFGGSGIGGGVTQGAQGAGAMGVNPHTYGIAPIDAAQINALNAQAEKLHAEAQTEKGENDRGAEEIKNIIAETNNKTLQAVFQEYQNTLAEIETTIEASLQDTKIQNYVKQTEYLDHITRSAKVRGNIDEKSENDIINFLHERTLNVAADTLLKKSQKKLNESNITLNAKQTEDLISQIQTRSKQVELNETAIKEQVKQWGIENGFTDRQVTAKLADIIWDNWNDTAGKVINLIGILKR